jgi:hypothetical protein
MYQIDAGALNLPACEFGTTSANPSLPYHQRQPNNFDRVKSEFNVLEWSAFSEVIVNMDILFKIKCLLLFGHGFQTLFVSAIF